jgi:hypothetical protein
MKDNTTDRIRTLVSLLLLTVGVIIIFLGAVRAFGFPIFQILFNSPIVETQGNAIVGMGIALTFIAIWLQQKPFVRLRKALGL